MDRPFWAPRPRRHQRSSVLDVLRECVSELRNVTWPGPRAVSRNGSLLLAVLAVAAGALAALGALR
jgi:preprotein translocase subunit SecE